jgi:hypothetical protein
VRAVIVAPAEDEHADAVAQSICAEGGELVRFDVERLAAESFVVTDDAVEIGMPAVRFSADATADRGWIRRLAPPDWRRGVSLRGHDGAVRAAWLALLGGLLETLPVEWLSPMRSLVSVENKVVQHRTACRLGIPTPATVVASSVEQVPAELGEVVVVKPLGPADYVDEHGEARVVFAGAVRRDDPRLGQLHAAPFLVQQLLEAELHLRAVVVRNRVWVCELGGEGRPLDWRRQEEAHGSFQLSVGHPEVRRSAGLLCRELGVGYASQDWIVTTDGAFFLDLNPSGQWLFLPEPAASEITHAISQWLAGEE